MYSNLHVFGLLMAYGSGCVWGITNIKVITFKYELLYIVANRCYMECIIVTCEITTFTVIVRMGLENIVI